MGFCCKTNITGFYHAIVNCCNEMDTCIKFFYNLLQEMLKLANSQKSCYTQTASVMTMSEKVSFSLWWTKTEHFISVKCQGTPSNH